MKTSKKFSGTVTFTSPKKPQSTRDETISVSYTLENKQLCGSIRFRSRTIHFTTEGLYDELPKLSVLKGFAREPLCRFMKACLYTYRGVNW